MRRLKYKLFTLLLAMLVVATSCDEEFLMLDPSDSISEEDVFNSYLTAQSALVGVYDQLSAYTFDGLFEPIMSDIMGEDVMINSVDNWNWFIPVYQLDILPNYQFSDSPWWTGYKVISDANKIIANASKLADATEEQKDQLEGEAKVLRAYVMLKLLQLYAPSYIQDKDASSIMLATEPLVADDANLPRAPLSLVYSQIETDLLSAIDLLDYKVDKGFFDKRSAQAVLARAYLNMQEWEKARDMAIEAYSGLSLVSASGLYDGFYYRNSETIFTIAYTMEDNNTYLTIPSFYYPVYGYSSMRANDQFVGLFSINDARSGYFLKDSQIDENRYLILKFLHNQSVGNAERISIRASEMYLIEAECETELGNYGEAQDALYTIQSRAYPGVQKSTSTGQVLINEILLERRKELFGEGFRLNDIKRRLGRLVREGDHWVKLDIGPEDMEYYHMTFPIPQSEIDANDMISEADQNIGY